ncbi:cell division protein FtsY [Lysobacter arseniciresistens ZS79]|uniref:Signal recognition particle receptor FtsY n=1 Tax=Lysobacter arseniciresistens ZS79 TaxID=913325 RepID=A0A0A0F4Y6_9GAMM|nr:signal recognition particle-docking protein FtsY [Lysobacter arseniciresistens]KGM57590.1 cell division protein FtsY [Lysobacter arseniciresistens ZS79]
MVSFFRRKKPETPAGSESARRYSAEELAAAFPTAPSGDAPVAPRAPDPAPVAAPVDDRAAVVEKPAEAVEESHDAARKPAVAAEPAETEVPAAAVEAPAPTPATAPAALAPEPAPAPPTPAPAPRPAPEAPAEPDLPGVANPGAAAAPAGKRGWRERLRGSAFARSFGGLFYTNPKLDEDLLDQIETALITADVGVAATTELVAGLRKRMNAREFADAHALLLALREQLLALLRPVAVPLRVARDGKPFVLLTVGVNGVGKTTTIGKLAKRFKDEGRPLMLAAGDTFRAAAVAQLQAWGERNGVAVIAQGQNADAASVAFDALQAATARNIEVLIADTAGRLHTQQGLMAELGKIKRVLQKIDPSAPHEVLMVIDGTTGQNAVSQLRQFHAAVGVTGLVVTKLDGTAKGGVVFALAREFGIPIRFAGIGERPEDLRVFDAEAFVDALLPETLGT